MEAVVQNINNVNEETAMKALFLILIEELMIWKQAECIL